MITSKRDKPTIHNNTKNQATMNFGKAMDGLAELESLHDHLVGLNIAEQARLAQQRGPPSIYAAFLPPPYINRLGFINVHDATISQGKSQGKSRNEASVNMKQTMRPHVQHGPPRPIGSLRHITLREVARKVNYIHEDSILFVKTIHDPHRIVGTSLLVEDTNGDCLIFGLYNYVPSNVDPEEYFPNGTYLALLAPYMKNSADDPTKNLMLRCDNPDCVRVFSSRRSWLAAQAGKKLVDTKGLDPKTLRKDGNKAFVEQKYEVASRMYSRALEFPSIAVDDKVACLSNLAESRIRQQQWEEAEKSARSVLEINEAHMKGRYRHAFAMSRLGKLDEASKIVEKNDQKEFRLLRAELSRLLEEQKGEYNFSKMQKEASSRPGEALKTFHCNFTSSSIKHGVTISKSGNFSYRGTIATKNIEEGTLLSSSKALVFCRPTSTDVLQVAFSIDPYSKRMQTGSQMEVENELVSLMHRRPNLREHVFSLSCGIDSLDNSGSTKIDTKRIRCIVTNNSFAAIGGETEITLSHFTRVLSGRSQSGSDEPNDRGVGLWVNESLFNHSCIPNSAWRQIGDQMFVFATKEVKTGEELTVSYVAQDRTYEERRQTFCNWVEPGLGFECQCDWCCMIRSSHELQQAEKRVSAAYREAAKIVSTSPMNMADAANKVIPQKERQVCFKTFSSFQISLQHHASADLWVMEGACLAAKNDSSAALQAYEKAAEIKYAVCGGFGLDRAKDLWRIVGASLAVGDSSKACTVLCTIYYKIFGDHINLPNKEEVFHRLTLHYSMPWWHDSYDIGRQKKLEMLIAEAMQSGKTQKETQQQQSKRKRRSNKKRH
jgi:SET domain